MEKELQHKIAWLEKRHAKMHEHVETLEAKHHLSDDEQFELKLTKKEKLRLKDQLEWMKKLENQLQKN